MFAACQYRMLLVNKIKSLLERLFFILTASIKVTVLLFMIAEPGDVRADNANETDLRLFEFTSEFYMPMGRGRLDGLMASAGSRHRISICWIEPAMFRDHTFFLGYSDFIFEDDVVHYWIYGVSKPGIFNLSGNIADKLLPRDVSVESVARSALAITNRIRSQSEQGDIPLEVGKFLRQSRDQPDYSYEVPSEQPSSERTSSNDTSYVQILNALPYGRKYSKETQSDGTLVWRAQRALNDRPVVGVTVKPVPRAQMDDASAMFNPDTLGRWMLVPEPYRAYWSFDQVYSDLKDAPDNDNPSRELYDRIESYLDNNKVPDKVCLALNQLWFKTALLTGDTHLVWRSAQAVVAALCDDVTVSSYQGLLELARIDVQIREKYPQQADELICPLIGQIVRHAGPNAQQSLERLMTSIENNKWFWYGKLLVEEVRIQGLLEKDIADTVVARLETVRLAKELPPSDPCEASASVNLYLAQLDADPPEGNLTIDDVRQILKEGFTKPFADANLEFKQELVEDVIQSIRLIAGEGPFQGDKGRLIESIQRFSWLYLVVRRKYGTTGPAIVKIFISR